jgi:hypothetical protein
MSAVGYAANQFGGKVPLMVKVLEDALAKVTALTVARRADG